MLQILRQGKDIIKDPKAWEKLKNVEDGKLNLFDTTLRDDYSLKSSRHEPEDLETIEQEVHPAARKMQKQEEN